MSLNVTVYAKPRTWGCPFTTTSPATVTLVGLDHVLYAPGVVRPEYTHDAVLELLFKATNAPEGVLSGDDKAFVEANKAALAWLWALSVGDVFKVTIGDVAEFKVCAPVGFVTTTQEAAKEYFDLPYEDRLYGTYPAPKGFGTTPMKGREFRTAVDNQAEVLLAAEEA